MSNKPWKIIMAHYMTLSDSDYNVHLDNPEPLWPPRIGGYGLDSDTREWSARPIPLKQQEIKKIMDITDIIADLRHKKAQLRREQAQVDKDIAALQSAAKIAEQYGDEPEEPPQPLRRTGEKVVTLENVRDAVVALGKDPPKKAHRSMLPGYFSMHHIATQMRVSKGNHQLRQYVRELVEQGVLHGEPFLNGHQWVYVPPPADATPTDRTKADAREYEGEYNLPSGRAHRTGSTKGKDVDKWLAEAQRQGGKAETVRSGHVTLVNPEGRSVTIITSPGSQAAIKKQRNRIRSLGFEV